MLFRSKKLAEAALELLRHPERRMAIQGKLDRIIAALGTSGANVRAAKAVWNLLEPGRGAR